MKLSSLLYVSILASLAMSKNVVNLDLFEESLQEENHHKREAKNVYNLQALKEGAENENDKREAKNVYNLQALKEGAENENNKREAKNVYNLQALKEGAENENDKREAKNVYNLQALKEGAENENDKREAKNVYNLQALKEGSTKGNKRSIQHIFDIQEQDTHQNLLQSILPQLLSISIFTGYIRDDPELAKKTADSEESLIIISPSDDAISNKLDNLKPWEFPTELTGNSDDDRIVSENLKNFLNGHVIVDFKDKFVTENDEIVANLLNGKQAKIKQEGVDKFKISTGTEWTKVEIVKQVDNGYIFVINDVLVKP